VAGSCRATLGKAVWHGLCNMGIVFARFFHDQSVRFSMPSINGNVKPVHRAPCPVQRGTPAHPLRYDKRCQPKAVAQRLSTISKSG
jgi:hypothetical protein